MNIRSMTGYAQVKAHVSDELTLTISLKSVNHRFLDLHLRLPSELDPVEMHRGHLEVTIAVERTGGSGFAVNRELVGGYLRTFRAVAEEFGVSAEPDLNVVLKLPGALNAAENGDAMGALLSAALLTTTGAARRAGPAGAQLIVESNHTVPLVHVVNALLTMTGSE